MSVFDFEKGVCGICGGLKSWLNWREEGVRCRVDYER